MFLILSPHIHFPSLSPHRGASCFSFSPTRTAPKLPHGSHHFYFAVPHETELPGCLLSVGLVAPSPLLGSERSSQHKLNFPWAVKAPPPLVPYSHFLPISLLSLACHHEASFPGHPLPPFTFFPLLEYQISCPQYNQPSRRSSSITTHILLYPLLGSHAFLYLLMVHFVSALWCGYSCSRVSQPAF